MKTRTKIILIAFSILFGILFIPVAASNLYCDYLTDHCTMRITGVGPGGVYLPAEWGTRENCSIANDDGTFEPCLIDIAQITWPFPTHMPEHEPKCDEICPDLQENTIDEKSYELSFTSFDKILDYCKEKETRNPIHQYGLSYSNDTHYIDNNTCEWQERKFVITTPFGYPKDHTGNFDHCFSYKTDPEYGVEIKNSTHILNPENCEWELKNEN